MTNAITLQNVSPALRVALYPSGRRERTEQERLMGMNTSITGLGQEAIARIEEIGFEAWLSEAEDVLSPKKTTVPLQAAQPKRDRPIKKLLCQKCGGVPVVHQGDQTVPGLRRSN
jgi:hypothetical protein